MKNIKVKAMLITMVHILIAIMISIVLLLLGVGACRLFFAYIPLKIYIWTGCENYLLIIIIEAVICAGLFLLVKVTKEEYENVLYDLKQKEEAKGCHMNENNMRKMILVEDRPWNVIESLKELEQQGVEIEEICWFVEQSMDSTFIEQKIAELSDKLKKVKIGTIDYTNFDSTMDGYMAREDIFVLMDTFLEAAPMRISNRINIRYAVKRKEEIQGKLWFYTTAGSDILSYLRENFGRKQVITVCGVEFVSNQVRLETQQIVKAGLRKREL